MENSLNTFGAILLLALFASVCCKETAQMSDASQESNHEKLHQAQKRSAILEPTETESGLSSDDEANLLSYLGAPYLHPVDSDKRSSLFRYGKRGGSLFRFGKRGSLLRYGKRGSFSQEGKRGGTLFRFGRSGVSQEDAMPRIQRTLFRFGKRSDLDSDAREFDGYMRVEPSKRGDSFHWGLDSDE